MGRAQKGSIKKLMMCAGHTNDRVSVFLLPAEGIALGVPVFFATGSRWKAIAWAAASGLAEPLGALIGLALQLTGHLNPVAMGLIMAVVAGVMTGIAFQELLPRYC